ncbi:MAG: PH domain-containing protein [Muribaculaceae bacterium]|nr:PH domain-containing protein [Muribaculaceae bacterium]
MGYIQKNLMSGEYVVHEAKLHRIIYAGPFAVALLAIGVFFIPNLAFIVKACIVLAIWLFTLGWAISIYGGRQYVVTNNRLIFKRGIINRSSHELLLKKCEGVQVDQTIPGRLLNYGTVIVTTGEVTNSYKFISHPLRFTTHIHEQISKLKSD